MNLSELQEDIIALVIEGCNNPDIAEKLHFSRGKIKKELEKIYQIFGIDVPDPTAKRVILVREVTKLELSKFMM